MKSKIANAFNKHFVSIDPKLAEEIRTEPNDFRTVDIQYILRALTELKNGKASGPDRIPVGLVKDASEFITLPLTLIYNSSLTSGVFPYIWKVAKVTPIFNSGARDDVNNYRPISVLSIFGRILEKIVHDRLIHYFNEKQLLTKNQLAFRKLHSTITSLINSTDEWLNNIDSQKINIAMFLDTKKAFDTVNHKMLLENVFRHVVWGKAISWFRSYFTERKQFCRMNGEYPKSSGVTCGMSTFMTFR